MSSRVPRPVPSAGVGPAVYPSASSVYHTCMCLKEIKPRFPDTWLFSVLRPRPGRPVLWPPSAMAAPGSRVSSPPLLPPCSLGRQGRPGGPRGCPDLGVWQVSLAMEASRQLERSQRGLLSLCAASDAAGPQCPSVRTPAQRSPRPPRPLGRDGGVLVPPAAASGSGTWFQKGFYFLPGSWSSGVGGALSCHYLVPYTQGRIAPRSCSVFTLKGKH